MSEQIIDPLKRVEEQLKKCVKCGACRANCPAFVAYGREPAVARGKIALAQHILKNDLELDEGTYQAMSKCLFLITCPTALWKVVKPRLCASASRAGVKT